MASSKPSTNNEAASVVNQILKSLIEGVGADLVKVTLIAQYPVLGLPVIKQFFGWIVDQVADHIYTDAAHAATSIVIDVQINGEKSAVLNAFQNMQMAIASGDAQAIQQTSRDLDQAYGTIIHYDGSASP